ncbi:hypothetical protein MHBO_001556, partial [Bonamia ostreae]
TMKMTLDKEKSRYEQLRLQLREMDPSYVIGSPPIPTAVHQLDATNLNFMTRVTSPLECMTPPVPSQMFTQNNESPFVMSNSSVLGNMVNPNNVPTIFDESKLKSEIEKVQIE